MKNLISLAKTVHMREYPFTYPESSERNPHSDYPFDLALKDKTSGKENGRYPRSNNGIRSVERKNVLLDCKKQTKLHRTVTKTGSTVFNPPFPASSICRNASNRQNTTNRTTINSTPWLRTKMGCAPARAPCLEKRNRYSGYQFSD